MLTQTNTDKGSRGTSRMITVSGFTRIVMAIFIAGFPFTIMCYNDFQEYCPYETFTATCHEHEIIMMTHAMYGRMRMGKCVFEELGSIGCSVNALPFLDKVCSGKVSCEYYIVGKDLADTKPCGSQVISYLEASYQCLEVARSADPYQCSKHASIDLKSSYGYISSELVHEEGWGTLTCPWILTALPGQSINITLINFKESSSRQFCKALGYSTDSEIDQNVTICDPTNREEHVMLSVGHKVKMQIIPDIAIQGNFVIQYQVIGCADLVAPDHAWHKRVGNNAIVGCEYQNKTWHLKCDGQSWLGVVGNCSSNEFPFLLIIIGIVAVTVLIGICIILLVLRPKCGCSKQPKPDSYPHFDANSFGTSYGYASNKAHTRSSWACTFKGGANTSNHIMDTPLPEPSAPPATEHMLAATMRHPNPMETSITSSGGDYTWPTRFMSPANHQQDQMSADYTHPSVNKQPDANDDYTVPINVTESLLQDIQDDTKNAAIQDDYMAPSEMQPNIEYVNKHHPSLPTDTFKRQLNKILHENQSPIQSAEDNTLSEATQGFPLSTEAMVEYAIPNSKRLSNMSTQEQPNEEEEYTLPASMRPPVPNEKSIPSAEQI